MTIKQAVEELLKLGTEQNRKVYQRHGVGENVYGVSFANLTKLKKQIKTDHELAAQLWDTGNHDARILATMVADPANATLTLLDSWKNDLDNYVVTDAFSKYVAATPLARRSADKWMTSKKEWIGRAGWMVLTRIALNDTEPPPEYFEECLETIESRIHSSPNRVRDAMNSALIAIALRSPSLETQGIEAARRIGKVEVDHGETDCKTHDAEAYILKARKQREHKPRKSARVRAVNGRKSMAGKK